MQSISILGRLQHLIPILGHLCRASASFVFLLPRCCNLHLDLSAERALLVILQTWRQIWRVAGRESGSPELLGSPRTSLDGGNSALVIGF